MPEAGRELVGAEGDEQDDADDEGESGCDDQEGGELVEISVGVVGVPVANDDGAVRDGGRVDIVILEVDVTAAGD